MIHAQNTKHVVLFKPGQTVATNATASSLTVDTNGYDYATIVSVLAPASATNASATYGTFALEETNDLTTYVTIINGVTASPADSQVTIAISNDSTQPNLTRIELPLGGSRRRYLRLRVGSLTASNTNICAYAVLSRAAEAPNTNAERFVSTAASYQSHVYKVV